MNKHIKTNPKNLQPFATVPCYIMTIKCSFSGNLIHFHDIV